MASNGLVANKEKTAFIYIPSTKNHETNTHCRKVNVGGVDILEGESEKLLGIKIDGSLDFKEHVKDIVSQSNQRFYLLRKVRPHVTLNQIKTLGTGLVMSKIEYCLGSFAHVYLDETESCKKSENMKKLQKVQNDLLRIITKSKLKDNIPIKNILGKLNYLSVNQLAAKQVLNTTWNFIKSDIKPMKELLQGIQRNDTLRSATKGFINPETMDRFSFPFQAKMLWNSEKLEQKFRESETPTIAKNVAKRFVKDNVPQIPWKN